MTVGQEGQRTREAGELHIAKYVLWEPFQDADLHRSTCKCLWVAQKLSGQRLLVSQLSALCFCHCCKRDLGGQRLCDQLVCRWQEEVVNVHRDLLQHLVLYIVNELTRRLHPRFSIVMQLVTEDVDSAQQGVDAKGWESERERDRERERAAQFPAVWGLICSECMDMNFIDNAFRGALAFWLGCALVSRPAFHE